MRKLLLLVLLLSGSLYAQPINAIVGDTSWYEYTGEWPSGEEDEQVRISTHLQYVYNRLVKVIPPGLSEGQLNKRQALLDELANYIEAGSFPRYYQHPYKRRPVFIDDKGTLCAVGHLLAADAGREEAERINSLFRLDFIMDMADEALLAWQAQSGFSLRELAMIQPTYGWEQRPVDPYYVFQDPETGLYGLKKNKGIQKTIIDADYVSIRYARNFPFVYGQKEDKWDLFLPNGKSLGKGFLRLDYLKKGESYRMVASSAKQVEMFDSTGAVVWKKPKAIFHEAHGSQFILKDTEHRSKMVCNWDGRILISGQDSIVSLSDMFRRPFAWKALGMVKYNASKDPDECVMSIRPAWQLIDTAGKRLHPEALANIQFERILFLLTDFEGRTSLHSTDGRDLGISNVSRIEPGLAQNAAIVELKEKDQIRRGILSGQGDWVVKPDYRELFIHTGHRYLARTDKGIGYIDGSGSVTIPSEYDTIVPMHSLYFVTKNERMGLFSWTGIKLLGLDYDTIGWLAQDGSNYSSNLIFSQREDLFEIRDQSGMLIPGFEGYDGFTRLYMGAVLLHKGEERIFAQFLHGQLQLKPEVKLDYARFLGGWSFAYGLNGKEGLWQIVHHRAIQASDFRKAEFDTVLPSHYQDNNHLLVRRDGLWGIYDIRGDSLLIPCESEHIYPYDRNAHSGWIYFRKQGQWYGYFYTVPELVLQMPAAQGRLEEMWREEGS